ncbi:MAG TPA: MFS transporter [Reyranella sp.]|jgi:MFS family permease
MTSWPRLLLIYAIGVVAAGQLGIVPPLVPALQAELGLSLATAGAVISIVTLVGGLLGLPAGAFAERIGHARAFRLGLLVMAIAAALCATAQGASLLLAARTLAGVGYLLVVVAGPSLMAALAERRHQPLALSLWGTFVPVGIALAGIATASFAYAGWRLLFAVDAALLVAALLAASKLRSPSSHAGDWQMPPGSLPAAFPLAVSFFCFALLFLALAGMLPAYLVEQRDMTAAVAGQTVAVATALGIVGSFAAAGLMHRGVTPGRLIAFGLAASTVAAIVSFRPEFGLSVSIRGVRPVVRDRRPSALRRLRLGAATGARTTRDRADQRAAGPGGQPRIARRAAGAGALGRAHELGLRAPAAGCGRRSRRRRDQRASEALDSDGFSVGC